MTLAPIVLFVYNRPWHTEQTLNYLMLNDLASDSVLYIYADGAKDNVSCINQKNIVEVRRIIRSKQWCKEVHLVESESNKGLANSIIQGVTEVITKHGKVIVLEDDLVTSEGFLRFINEALEMYKNEERVAGISGFSFIESKDDTYFLNVGTSWGWGTWRRVWVETNFDTGYWLKKFNNRRIISKFNIDNNYDYYKMLNEQYRGKIDSWAVRFYCSYFFKQQLFLYPKRTMIFNIGFDEGTHYTGAERSTLEEYKHILKTVLVKRIVVVEKISNKKLLVQHFKRNNGKHLYRLFCKAKGMMNKWLRN